MGGGSDSEDEMLGGLFDHHDIGHRRVARTEMKFDSKRVPILRSASRRRRFQTLAGTNEKCAFRKVCWNAKQCWVRDQKRCHSEP